MKKYMIILLLLLLTSCATTKGPVHMATNEQDAIKRTYDDPTMKVLYEKNEALLKQIYARFTAANVNIYKEGIGLTLLSDQKNQKLRYIMVSIRPGELNFDENTTTPEQRFSYVIKTFIQKYVTYMKKEDLDRDDIEGLAFGVYWPVRDFSQCDTYGGFIEYIRVYFDKDDVFDILDRTKTFQEVVDNTEIITSLNQAPPVSVKPVF